MNKLSLNQSGFAHNAVFLVMIVGVVGLIGFSGHRVWLSSSAAKRNATSSQAELASNANTADQKSKQYNSVTINKSGTAAASVKPTASNTTSQKVTEQLQLTPKYDIKTPEGSLNQLIFELKSQNFSNALYFITPGFMFKTSDILNSSGPATLDQCKASVHCNTLLNAQIPDIKASSTKPYSIPSVTVEGKSLLFNTTIQGVKYNAQVDMLNIHTNWVVDKVTINGYTL